MNTVPSLNEICRKAVSQSQFWRIQTRHLEALNEDDAEAIVSLLIQRGALPPDAIWAFRSCLTTLHVRRRHLRNAGKWMEVATRLPHLRSLTLASLVRARDAVPIKLLNSVTALAPQLQTLVLENISAPIPAIAEVVGKLTSLTSFRIVDSSGGGELMPLELQQLQSLALLQNLELEHIYLGSDKNALAPLSTLTSLRSISILDPCPISEVDYTQGGMSLGVLPQLESFSFQQGVLSCPPAATTLTCLEWDIKVNGEADDHAQVAWLELKSTLPRLQRLVISARCFDDEEVVVGVIEQIIGGAGTSLTSLELIGELSGSSPPIPKRMIGPVVPYLSALTQLEELELTNGERDWDIVTALSAISRMPNLRKLVMQPAPLRTLRELAMHGHTTLSQLTELHLCDVLFIVYHGGGASSIRNRLEDGEGLVPLNPSIVLPSLKTLHIEDTSCDLTGWRSVAAIVPGLEYLSLKGTFSTWHSPLKGMDAIREAQRGEDKAIKAEIHLITQNFTGLKELRIKEYVLDRKDLARARDRGLSLNLKTLGKVPDERKTEIEEVQEVPYLAALTPEILQYDERYRYSTEELMALRWEGEGVMQARVNGAADVRESVPSELLAVL